MKDRYILAFETSCDETSVAVLKNDDQLLSNVIASQIESHKRFGGVVPEVASRHHVEVITACIEEALEEAGITEADVTAVAVTYGPRPGWSSLGRPSSSQGFCLGARPPFDSCQSYGRALDGRSKRRALRVSAFGLAGEWRTYRASLRQ